MTRIPPECNPHPDAPHGFDRNGSLNEDRYVCDCESWEADDPDWFRKTPESMRLLQRERRRLAVTECWWGLRERLADHQPRSAPQDQHHHRQMRQRLPRRLICTPTASPSLAKANGG